MSLPRLQNIAGRWFVGGCWGRVSSNGYFNCNEETCPFSVKLVMATKDGKKVPIAVERVVFALHCHEMKDREKAFNRDSIQAEIDLINEGKDDGSLQAKHKRWQKEAVGEGDDLKEEIIDKKTVQRYATQRPQLSGREIIDRSSVRMSKQAVHNSRARQMKTTHDITNFETLIALKNHHLLTNEGEDILVFGCREALSHLASTKFMFADGTFRCVPHEYSQLYIFHAHVANNVSFPQLFCLVKGKTAEFYTRLLLLVEGLAAANGMTFFNRQVTLMCDFESSFINTVRKLFGSVTVKCCLFHYEKLAFQSSPHHQQHQATDRDNVSNTRPCRENETEVHDVTSPSR